jgi:flagellar biosynthesis/type III secretory pathway protein FliH
MKDSSSASITFTFEDLALRQGARKTAAFVGLFPSRRQLEAAQQAVQEEAAPSKEEQEAASEASREDQSRQAFEDAYVQGEKAGYEMGMRRVESTIKRLEKQIEEVVSFKQTLTGKYEKLATEMALIFAEAIVLRECSERREALAGMIRKALQVCEDRGEIVIKVRTKDVEQLDGLSSSYLKIIGDDTLGEPGFVIETAMGDIDGRISIQLEELKKALIESDAG